MERKCAVEVRTESAQYMQENYCNSGKGRFDMYPNIDRSVSKGTNGSDTEYEAGVD